MSYSWHILLDSIYWNLVRNASHLYSREIMLYSLWCLYLMLILIFDYWGNACLREWGEGIPSSVFVRNLWRISILSFLNFGGIYQWSHLEHGISFVETCLAKFYFFYRRRNIRVTYFFLSELWYFVSFKNLSVSSFSNLLT